MFFTMVMGIQNHCWHIGREGVGKGERGRGLGVGDGELVCGNTHFFNL